MMFSELNKEIACCYGHAPALTLLLENGATLLKTISSTSDGSSAGSAYSCGSDFDGEHHIRVPGCITPGKGLAIS